MNKSKRKIIKLKANFVRKVASQIQPFDLDMRWLNEWYTKNLVTPLQAGSILMKMKENKLNKAFFLIHMEDNLRNSWGNVFTIKFPLCVFVSNKSSDEELYLKWYNSFLDTNLPDEA